jgi:hypothetical protein
MAKINDIHSIIVPANAPVFSAHTYSEIYGGSAGCTAVVNGTSVAIGATSNISIWVRTITGGAGCFLLGENNDVVQGSTRLG